MEIDDKLFCFFQANVNVIFWSRRLDGHCAIELIKLPSYIHDERHKSDTIARVRHIMTHIIIVGYSLGL